MASQALPHSLSSHGENIPGGEGEERPGKKPLGLLYCEVGRDLSPSKIEKQVVELDLNDFQSGGLLQFNRFPE